MVPGSSLTALTVSVPVCLAAIGLFVVIPIAAAVPLILREVAIRRLDET
jgi:hypothetical protein